NCEDLPQTSNHPGENCVTVSVYRNGEFGSAFLPTYFTNVFGLNSQGVKAQAKALAVAANTTSCLWPIAISDSWQGTTPTEFDPATDWYTAPKVDKDGTANSSEGYQLNVIKLNASVSLTLIPAPTLSSVIRPGQFVPVTVPRSDGGGFTSNLGSC